jgi:hypothetical protein
MSTAAITARVSRDLEMAGIDPATGLPPAAPPRPAPTPSYDLAAALAPGAARVRNDGQEAAAGIRRHHEQQMAAYTSFCEVIAAHEHITVAQVQATPGMKTCWEIIHRAGHARRQETERRAESVRQAVVDPTAPGRDASDRFVRGG